MKPEPIEGDGIRLRLFRDDDAEAVTIACADPLTQEFISTMPSPYTIVEARWWITEGVPAVWAAGGAVYAIVDPSTDHLLGGAGLSHPVPDRGQVEIGYWVAPWARRRGVATAATRTLAAYAFNSGFARIELLTREENIASQRVALAAGFRREGLRCGAAPARDGGRHDLIAWVRLAGEPGAPTARLLPDLPSGGLSDGVVSLRPVGPDDVVFLHRLHTSPDVVANRVPPVPPSLEQIARRCARAQSRWLAGEGADLVIVDAENGVPIGGCALTYQDVNARQAMIGYSLVPERWGRGMATRAVRLLTEWAFGSVGVIQLSAGVRPENTGSRRVLEKAGFRQEGLLRHPLALSPIMELWRAVGPNPTTP